MPKLFCGKAAVGGNYNSTHDTIALCMEFENDVKEYGIQTTFIVPRRLMQFENDVKEYGIQTTQMDENALLEFENDVKEYGIQTALPSTHKQICLRMM